MKLVLFLLIIMQSSLSIANSNNYVDGGIFNADVRWESKVLDKLINNYPCLNFPCADDTVFFVQSFRCFRSYCSATYDAFFPRNPDLGRSVAISLLGAVRATPNSLIRIEDFRENEPIYPSPGHKIDLIPRNYASVVRFSCEFDSFPHGTPNNVALYLSSRIYNECFQLFRYAVGLEKNMNIPVDRYMPGL